MQIECTVTVTRSSQQFAQPAFAALRRGNLHSLRERRLVPGEDSRQRAKLLRYIRNFKCGNPSYSHPYTRPKSLRWLESSLAVAAPYLHHFANNFLPASCCLGQIAYRQDALSELEIVAGPIRNSSVECGMSALLYRLPRQPVLMFRALRE